MLDFQKLQFELVEKVKQGQGELENIESRRLNIYKELFYNNIEGFCRNTFPILAGLLGDKCWFELVRHFFSQHSSVSPHFVDISEEFLNHIVENQLLPHASLYELAHYEWLELVVLTTNVEQNTVEGKNNINWQVPTTTHPVAYQFPVHEMSVKQNSFPEPEPTSLIIYNRDGDVQFLKVDPLSVFALQVLKQQDGLSTQELVDLLAKQIPHISEQEILKHLQSSLSEYRAIGAIT